MKTITNLAANLGVTHGKIRSIIKQQGIICDVSKPKARVNEFQEEIIQTILIYEGKIDGFIFESKMHEIQEPEQESWESFKAKTYGQKKLEL